MNRLISLAACTCVLLCHAQVFGTSWDTVVFRDDFDSSVGGMPDPSDWVVNRPGEWWWIQGRTHFPNPDPWLPTGEFPRVENGVCIIEHHLHNRFDSQPPYDVFLGGEVHTVLEFEPTGPYCLEARVRLRSDLPLPYVPYPDGLVTSFFTYGHDGSNSDEIDFEFLSSLMNSSGNPNGDPFLTNTFDESPDYPLPPNQKPECIAPGPEGLVLTDWNTFRIYWYPGVPRIDWTWVVDRSSGQEVLLRTETDPDYIPDEPMALYFNFWATPGPWDDPCDPYDPDLEPVDDPSDNAVCVYEIDYVEVRAPASIPTVSEWGLAIMTLLLLTAGTVVLIRRQPGEAQPTR